MTHVVMSLCRTASGEIYTATQRHAEGYETQERALTEARAMLKKYPYGAFAVFERVALVENQTKEVIRK